MTDRLVSEIMYHIDLYGMKPTRIRFSAGHFRFITASHFSYVFHSAVFHFMTSVADWTPPTWPLAMPYGDGICFANVAFSNQFRRHL